MAELVSSGFWNLDDCSETEVAVSDGAGFSMTYRELHEAASNVADELSGLGTRQLGFIRCTGSPAWLAAYLGTLIAGHVPLLLPDTISDDLLTPLLSLYGPRWIWHEPAASAKNTDFRQLKNTTVTAFRQYPDPLRADLHPELGCLLSTSGSTGSPKLVRLSYGALDANARSIARYLGLSPGERALTTLPTSYSYGLSVVNSHISAGAALVCRTVSPISRDFVETIKRERVTSLAGVPSWYQMLLRTGFDKADTPSVRTLTQAGGRLDERIKRSVLAMAERKRIRFYVMYGQTEATARISYVPPEALSDHMDSIGIPIPGGQITLDPGSSEIIYHGPNVMMGYADSAEDLSKPDECCGVLRTGDVGSVDETGYFRVTGRIKRVVKLSGSRFGLDEIEVVLTRLLAAQVAVAGRDERLGVYIEGTDLGLVHAAKSHLADTYGIHPSLFKVDLLDTLPLLPTGKKDYGALLERLG
jgi:acyl-CoA synthetase (AMP-forming)/AMP-acid ligase II